MLVIIPYSFSWQSSVSVISVKQDEMIPALCNLIKHTSSLKMHLKNAVWFALFFAAFCVKMGSVITTVVLLLL